MMVLLGFVVVPSLYVVFRVPRSRERANGELREALQCNPFQMAPRLLGNSARTGADDLRDDALEVVGRTELDDDLAASLAHLDRDPCSQLLGEQLFHLSERVLLWLGHRRELRRVFRVRRVIDVVADELLDL